MRPYSPLRKYLFKPSFLSPLVRIDLLLCHTLSTLSYYYTTSICLELEQFVISNMVSVTIWSDPIDLTQLLLPKYNYHQ